MEAFDVVVCGAGSAGFCAAIRASRSGARTALIEKFASPGGILTVTGNNSIDQFNNPFLEGNRMIIGGIGWEFSCRLAKLGFAIIPDMNAPYQKHWQYGVKVNPAAASALMDEMLLEAGVTLFYTQQAVDTVTDGRRLTDVVITTKAGLKRLGAKVFVDCTGDGDLSAWAGAAFEAGDGHGGFQPGTLRYYPAGMSCSDGDRVLNFGDNTNHVGGMDATDSDKLTAAQIEGRRAVFAQMLAEKENGERVMAIAPETAPREGRRILGKSYMHKEDFVSGRLFEDSICYSFWFVDIHRENQPTYHEYITDGSTPTVRLSAMMARDFDNLLMAGRCVSSDRATNSALRVKASCMAMGEAAGEAAAMAADSPDGNVERLDIADLKRRLAAGGAIVPGVNGFADFAEMLAPYGVTPVKVL